MGKETFDMIVKKTRELINAQTCCAELKEAAQSFLNAIGTEKEKTAAKNYIKELEADIMPIDQLIAFADSDAGKQYFGTETAQNIAAHAKEIKAAGAKYCDCPACVAAETILANKESIL